MRWEVSWLCWVRLLAFCQCHGASGIQYIRPLVLVRLLLELRPSQVNPNHHNTVEPVQHYLSFLSGRQKWGNGLVLNRAQNYSWHSLYPGMKDHIIHCISLFLLSQSTLRPLNMKYPPPSSQFLLQMQIKYANICLGGCWFQKSVL